MNVLRDQRRRKYAELRGELKVLVNNIVELEAAGNETNEAKQVSTWLKAEISDSLKLLTRLDEQVKTASEAEFQS